MKNKTIEVSIIIVNFNTSSITIDCLNSIFRHTQDLNYEIILLDNGSKSTDVAKLLKFIKEKKQVRFIKNKANVGFAKGNNQAMLLATGAYVLLLNSDTYLESDIINKVYGWMESHPRVGLASCQLYNKDGSIQGSGGYFPTLAKVLFWMFMLDDLPLLGKIIKPFHPAHKYKINKGNLPEMEIEYDWLTGAFLMVKRQTLKDVKGFDEDYFMYVEDVDLCFRAKKAGWQVWLLPQFGIVHLGGSSSTSEYPLISEFKNLVIFYKKHMPSWQSMLLPLIFKIGVLLRVVILGILKGPRLANLYVKTFKLI